MGHLHEIKKEYKDLRTRLDKYPVGAPESEHLYEILRILFTGEQAAVAARMPVAPSTIEAISKRTGLPAARLQPLLESMADKGLVMDIHSEKSGKTFYLLAPTVIGFFEFTFMRTRDDFDQKKLAEAMHHYMYDTKDFANEAFTKSTQLGRAIVHETAISEDDMTEVLDWERASSIIEEAASTAVSLCYCRHKARHNGTACGRPEEICMTLNEGADWLISKNLSRRVSKSEMFDLLARAREEGLVHTADNVKNKPGFICNCCGCCCGMLSAINKQGIKNAVHTSSFIATVDKEECKGCGKCAKRCPISAITINETTAPEGKKTKWAEVDKSVCLGCGVCHAACKFEALSMKKRKQRVITPENSLDRILTMAIERGKLHYLLLDALEGPSAEFLKTLAGAVLSMPLSKQILLNKEIKSRFLDFASSRANA